MATAQISNGGGSYYRERGVDMLADGPRTDLRTSEQHTKGNKQAEDEANKDAEVKIKEIQASGKKNQAEVVEGLLRGVLDVKPVPPSAA